jgi:hypothetical protein
MCHLSSLRSCKWSVSSCIINKNVHLNCQLFEEACKENKCSFINIIRISSADINIKIKIYKTVILPAVLCGYKTWSLTLSKGHRVKVFEDRVLKRIFGPERDEITGGWRKLHVDELQNLYISPKYK